MNMFYCYFAAGETEKTDKEQKVAETNSVDNRLTLE